MLKVKLKLARGNRKILYCVTSHLKTMRNKGQKAFRSGTRCVR